MNLSSRIQRPPARPTGGIESLEPRRLLSAGDLDLSFGSAGQAFSPVGALSNGYLAVAPDGKLVVAANTWGRYDTRVALGRVNPDGSPDGSFGGDLGTVGIPRVVPPDDTGVIDGQSVTGLAVLPDRRVLITGLGFDEVEDAETGIITERRGTFIMRLREDGAPDPTFGGGDGIVMGAEGIVQSPYDVPRSTFRGLVIGPGGKFLTTRSGSLYRFNADGTPDVSFGTGGAAPLPLPPGGRAFDALKLAPVPGPSGDVVVVGALAPAGGGTAAFAIARLHSDGSPAASFGGGDGLVVEPVGAAALFANVPSGLAVGPDGAVVVGGSRGPEDQTRFAVARYTAIGTRDASFGRGGADGDAVVSVGTPGHSWERGAFDVAVQADGKAIASGNTGRVFSVVRLTAAGALDPTFAPGGGDGDGLASMQFIPADVPSDFSEGRSPPFAVAIQPDGKVVAASGQAISDGWGSSGGATLVRFHGDATAASARTYEAERASITGARVSAAHPGFGGTGFVDYVLARGESVEFTVDAPAAGRYALGFRYANGGSSARTMGLSVGGAPVTGGVSFVPTGAWDTWVTAGATVNLAAGRNRIVLSSTGRSGPNLDALSAQAVDRPVPVTYQAESAAAVGATVAAANSGFTGTGYRDYQHYTDDYVEFAIDAPVADYYALDFRYANGGTTHRPMHLLLDGQLAVFAVDFAPTGSWRNWATSRQSLLLTAGRHTIRLTASGSSGPNLDALVVRRGADPL